MWSQIRIHVAVVVALLATACSGSGGFGGNSGKQINAKPSTPSPLPAKPAPQPAAPKPPPAPVPGDLGTKGETPAPNPNPNPQPNQVVPPLVVPLPAPQPVPRPQPQPLPPPTPLPEPQALPQLPPAPQAPTPVTPPSPPPAGPSGEPEKGALQFNAVPFVNMEHRAHASEPGAFAILKDGAGKVLAAGPMTPEVACRGENRESMAYPVVTLNVPLVYLAGGAESGANASGNGTLSVCLVNDASAAGDALVCKKESRGNDGDRPAFWYDRPVAYTVSAGAVVINNAAGYGGGGGMQQGGGEGWGLYGGGENVAGGLSFAHPIQSPVCGSKARGYADYNSPLVLDLDGDGLELTSVWAGTPVSFDVLGDGNKVRTGWVFGDDALLALDVDGNGRIDSGAELFGENSARAAAKDKWAFRNFESGFQALAAHDANEDGAVDAKDPVFARLLLWQDGNQNGVSEPGELTQLAQSPVQSLSLAYAKTGSPGRFEMVAMNEVRLKAEWTAKDGTRRALGDVWFAARGAETAKKTEGSK